MLIVAEVTAIIILKVTACSNSRLIVIIIIKDYHWGKYVVFHLHMQSSQLWRWENLWRATGRDKKKKYRKEGVAGRRNRKVREQHTTLTLMRFREKQTG